MKNSIELMNLAADNIRILSAAMVEKAKSGHPGGAMGGADFINVLFSEYLVFDPENPCWEGRDRFFLDPGHMSPMLYSALTLIGKYSIDEIKTFRQWGSPATGHPERCIERGIENTSGPLGQGHAYAVGAAIAAKFMEAHLGNPTFGKERIYTYISDGGVQEEISQGAGRMAGLLGLNNLIMFYDDNDIQLSTETNVVSAENTAMKYRSWNWNVYIIDGNDCAQIRKALDDALNEKDRPTLIIGKCIMGKGCRDAQNNNYERSCKTHGAPLGKGAYENTIKNLGGDIDNPFTINGRVLDLYRERLDTLKTLAAERHEEEQAWAKAHPEEAAKQTAWFANQFPAIDWDNIAIKADDATRNASSAVLSELGEKFENMIVASADLCNSDKTDGFLKKTRNIKNGDFGGNFFQAGVSELTMACCCMGMMLHGGITTALGTFFVFSDYMKPAIRMAALMEIPIKFIWSHDSFRVGEDGPTHEPIEQEAQIRLMEKVKNFKGNSSILVMRPCDTKETIRCWKMVMENTATPSALILTRQTVKALPETTPYQMAEKGAYVVESDANPDVILLASGSEVSTLAEVSTLLRKEGIKTRVVSVPSEGLFRKQSPEYQNEVLPCNTKKYGLTAGLSVNLQGLVGNDGKIWSVEHFGSSAPFKVLEDKFGFTVERQLSEIKAYINK